jgi:hypothetical protein
MRVAARSVSMLTFDATTKRVALVVKRPFPMPRTCLGHNHGQVFYYYISHWIRFIPQNDTWRDERVVNVNVTKGNVFKIRTAGGWTFCRSGKRIGQRAFVAK